MGDLKAILGDTVVGKDGNDVSVDSLGDKDLIGIYFSAHWCPPCRGFTPALAECYNSIKKKEKKFEIVFVSSDRDQTSFDEYYNEMPWLAVKFEDRERKEKLSHLYGIQGIPTLVLVKPSGELLTKSGRQKVGEDPEGNSFPWA